MIFKTKEEKEIIFVSKIEEKIEKDRRNSLIEKVKKICFFPGNKQEYEEFRGYKVEIIDTQRADMGITSFEIETNLDFGEYLTNQGIEAIINLKLVQGNYRHYGLPVRKARN